MRELKRYWVKRDNLNDSNEIKPSFYGVREVFLCHEVESLFQAKDEEIARLRDALREIADIKYYPTEDDTEIFRKVALSALEVKHDPA